MEILTEEDHQAKCQELALSSSCPSMFFLLQKYMPKEVAAAIERNRAAIEGSENDEMEDHSPGKGSNVVVLESNRKKNEEEKKPSKLSKLGKSPQTSVEYEASN